MWEQRYGFPEPGAHRDRLPPLPDRGRRDAAPRRRPTASAGCRCPRRSSARREPSGPTDRPSIYAAVAVADPRRAPQVLRKSHADRAERAIEHEALARAAAPVLLRRLPARALLPRGRAALPAHGAAGRRGRRVRRLRRASRRTHGGPSRCRSRREDALGNEWAVIVDAPGYAACLLAWEQPSARRARRPARPRPALRGDLDDRPRGRRAAPRCRRAARRARRRRARRAPARTLLAERPLALSSRRPALTTLTNRIVSYLED